MLITSFVVLLIAIDQVQGNDAAGLKVPGIKTEVQPIFVPPRFETERPAVDVQVTPNFNRRLSAMIRRYMMLQILREFLVVQSGTTGATTSTTTTTTAAAAASTDTTSTAFVPSSSPTATSTTSTPTLTSTSASTTTLPEPFGNWHEFKGCRYRLYTTPKDEMSAKDTCAAFGTDIKLAHRNVRTAADRTALFVDGLGLSGQSVWLGLRDADGSSTDDSPVWFDGESYVTEDGVTVEYAATTFSSIAFATGEHYDGLIYVSEYRFNTNYFVCEYCP